MLGTPAHQALGRQQNMGFLSKIFGGENEPTQRVKDLMEQMRSEDPAVRKAACDEAAEWGGEARPATELLEELLQDEDDNVCSAAAAAITRVVRDL